MPELSQHTMPFPQCSAYLDENLHINFNWLTLHRDFTQFSVCNWNFTKIVTNWSLALCGWNTWYCELVLWYSRICSTSIDNLYGTLQRETSWLTISFSYKYLFSSSIPGLGKNKRPPHPSMFGVGSGLRKCTHQFISIQHNNTTRFFLSSHCMVGH